MSATTTTTTTNANAAPRATTSAARSAFAGVNLVPAQWRAASQREHRVHNWTGGVVAYVLLLGAAFAVFSTAFGAANEDLGAMLDRSTRQAEELNRSMATLRPQLAEAQTRLSVARIVGDQPHWSQLLAIVGATMDDDMVLTNVHLESAASDETPAATSGAANATGAAAAPSTRPTRAGASSASTLTLSVQGLARNQSAVAQFVLRLERLELFDHVQTVSTGRQSHETGELSSFRIECTIGRGTTPTTASPANNSNPRGGAR